MLEDKTRREFLELSAKGFVVAAVIDLTDLPITFASEKNVLAYESKIPASEGYLLVDSKKCQGCMSCMLACSLVHEGKQDLSSARIQVVQNQFEKFPENITLAQCYQCESPMCLDACVTGALHIETKDKGYIRVIDEEKCLGEECKECISACPYEPSRPRQNIENNYVMKCDLCLDTSCWNEQGGVNGKQACVEICSVNAIKFTKEIPFQNEVNLRKGNKLWKKLGYSVD